MKFLMLILFLVFAGNTIAQSNKPGSPSKNINAIDVNWIKTSLANWDSVSHFKLKLNNKSLPWIIFYDSSFAWHLNPEEISLPAHTKTANHFLFAGKTYYLYRVKNTNKLWVPDREAIDLSHLSISAMPYSNNKKTFFIAPLPSLFHRLALPAAFATLDLLFFGTCSHELTHTLQLPSVLSQLSKLQRDYKLPEHLDDNIIEELFGKNDGYNRIFNQEKQRLWNAVATNNMDTCRNELVKALALAEERKKTFFTGDSLAYSYLDDIFLSLEGSAMWVQYQVTLKYAAANQAPEKTLFWLVTNTNAWSQEEGLALFILINKFVPDWKQQFFGKELPSPFQILNNAVKLENR